MPDGKFFEGYGYGMPQYQIDGEWWFWIPGTGTMPESILEKGI